VTRFRPPGGLGCGGAPLGNLFERVPEPAAAESLQAAWDSGIRYFDTAPFYGFGLSERRMGDALRGRPVGSFTLSTKVGRLLKPAAGVAETRNAFVGGLPFEVVFDYSAAATWRSLEDSLQRLGLPRIDIAFIHDCAEDTHGQAWTEMFDAAMAGAAKALTEAREQGLIRAWGLGVNRIEPCLMALERADPDVFLVAGRYTLLVHTALAALFPACAARGVSVVVGGPYNSGLLAGGTTFDYEAAPAEMAARVLRIGAVCARHGVQMKAVALQFCAAHPVVASVIAGARRAAEVRENVAMMGVAIPGDLWADLRREGLIPEQTPVPG